jgi:hypothetical protein
MGVRKFETGMFALLAACVVAVRRPRDSPTQTYHSTTPPGDITPERKSVQFTITQKAILYTTFALAGFVIISGAIVTYVLRCQRRPNGAVPLPNREEPPVQLPEIERDGTALCAAVVSVNQAILTSVPLCS